MQVWLQPGWFGDDRPPADTGVCSVGFDDADRNDLVQEDSPRSTVTHHYEGGSGSDVTVNPREPKVITRDPLPDRPALQRAESQQQQQQRLSEPTTPGKDTPRVIGQQVEMSSPQHRTLQSPVDLHLGPTLRAMTPSRPLTRTMGGPPTASILEDDPVGLLRKLATQRTEVVHLRFQFGSLRAAAMRRDDSESEKEAVCARYDQMRRDLRKTEEEVKGMLVTTFPPEQRIKGATGTSLMLSMFLQRRLVF